MSIVGILNILAGVLELCVPSYALRLVRRFGAHQVGSFVIIAFASLAVLHLFNPLKPLPGSGVILSVVYATASGLLLIGMGHVETLCQQRERTQQEERELRAKLELETRQKTDDLLKVRHEMAAELVRLQRRVESLTTSERQFRFLFAHHPHPMWIFDLRSGRILAGNESALAQYGYTELEFTALSAKDLMAREAAEAFRTEAAKPCCSVESRGIWRHRRKDRTPLDVEVMTVDLRFGDCPARLIFAEDTSPRVSREAELCDFERMRILRRMAEGVAHHFGRILTVVEGQTGLLGNSTETFPGSEHVEQVLSETRRGSALIRQLLAVGACEGIQPEAVDLNAFIREKESLLKRLVGGGISLDVHFGDGLSPILADVRVLDHIVVNLVLNARDAMVHGGSLDIHTEPVWVDPYQKGHQLHANVTPGQFVRLRVRDNGSGMPAEIQQHLFEPFFTTRADDKAMGLGLATIYGAVKQHGGWVEFASQPGHGSEFSVFLPVWQAPTPSATAQEPTPPRAKRETILLVETDDQVRDLARHILARNGYQVIEADTPSTATVLMEAQAKNVQLLLTDLNFPNGSSGRELADQLRQMNSDLKVVYATGPLSTKDTEPAVLQEAKLLLKPYTPDRLLQTLASCLGRQVPQRG
jgi:PAS domain S-box-containing protein